MADRDKQDRHSHPGTRACRAAISDCRRNRAGSLAQLYRRADDRATRSVIAGHAHLQNSERYFAITAAWAGEKELALQQLEAGLRGSQRIIDAELRRTKAASSLGPAPRRSALRKNRRVARAEKTVKLNQAVLRKEATLDIMKYWETIADNLSKAGWSWGCVSATDSRAGEAD